MHPQGLQLENARGERRGWVDPKHAGSQPHLEDLWIMIGSLCDLKCKHCYTASSPSNGRLEQIRFDELRPHLDTSRRYGVERIFFTGGEVFVNEDVLTRRAATNEDLLESLALALEIAPVEILTNGRKHIRSHFADLAALRAQFGSRLRLRITLESWVPAEHDAIRGRGTFADTVETVRQLSAMGFIPVITAERPFLRIQNDDEVRLGYEGLFADAEVEINLIENVLEMGHRLVEIAKRGEQPRPEVFVSENCFHVLGRTPESLMCHSTRCIQKLNGQLRYYPCPVIYDDERFDLGGTLEESWRRVYIAHKNCYDYCLRGAGSTCRTRPL
jgi:MoaA/NifB/PqqE/SkfB family radical SAM enzyme